MSGKLTVFPGILLATK